MVFIINIIIEMINIIYCVESLLNRKLKISRKMILLILVDVAIYFSIEIFGLHEKYQFVLYLMLLLYVCDRHKITLIKGLEKIILSITIVSVIQLSISIVYFICRIPIQSSIESAILIQALTFVVILLFEKLWNIIGDFTNQSNVFDKFILGLFPMGIVTILIKYKMNIGIEKSGFLMIVFGGIFLAKIVYDWQKEKTELEIKKEKLHVSEMYYKSFAELIMSIRKKQHDFNNHLQAIYALHYSTSNYQELVFEQKKYLDAISYNNDLYKLLNIQNPILAGFIYQKIIDANSKDYIVSCDVQLEHKMYTISEYVLIELIGILWDNAIEASEELEHKKISIIARDSDERLEISISNPIEDIPYNQILDFFNIGNTTKGKNRGIGLDKVKDYKNRYKFDLIVTKEHIDSQYWICIKIILPQ